MPPTETPLTTPLTPPQLLGVWRKLNVDEVELPTGVIGNGEPHTEPLTRLR